MTREGEAPAELSKPRFGLTRSKRVFKGVQVEEGWLSLQGRTRQVRPTYRITVKPSVLRIEFTMSVSAASFAWIAGSCVSMARH